MIPSRKNQKKPVTGIDHWSFEDGGDIAVTPDPLNTITEKEGSQSAVLADMYEQPVADLDGVGVDVPTEPLVSEANDEIHAVGEAEGMEPEGEPDAELEPHSNLPAMEAAASAEHWFQSMESLSEDLIVQGNNNGPLEGEVEADPEAVGIDLEDEAITPEDLTGEGYSFSVETVQGKTRAKISEKDEGDVIKKAAAQSKTLAKAIVKAYEMREKRQKAKTNTHEGFRDLTKEDAFWILLWTLIAFPIGSIIAWWIANKKHSSEVESFKQVLEECEDLINEIKKASSPELKKKLNIAFHGMYHELESVKKNVSKLLSYQETFASRVEFVEEFYHSIKGNESFLFSMEGSRPKVNLLRYHAIASKKIENAIREIEKETDLSRQVDKVVKDYTTNGWHLATDAEKRLVPVRNDIFAKCKVGRFAKAFWLGGMIPLGGMITAWFLAAKGGPMYAKIGKYEALVKGVISHTFTALASVTNRAKNDPNHPKVYPEKIFLIFCKEDKHAIVEIARKQGFSADFNAIESYTPKYALEGDAELITEDNKGFETGEEVPFSPSSEGEQSLPSDPDLEDGQAVSDDTLGVPDVVAVVNARSVDAVEPDADDGVNVVLPEDLPEDIRTTEGFIDAGIMPGDDTQAPELLGTELNSTTGPITAVESYEDLFPEHLGEAETFVDVQGDNPEELQRAVVASAERWFVSVEDGIEGLQELGEETFEPGEAVDKKAGKGTVEGEGIDADKVVPETELKPDVKGTAPAAAQPKMIEEMDSTKATERWLNY